MVANASKLESRDILPEIFVHAENVCQSPRAPTRTSRIRATTQGHTRIVMVYLIERNHINFNRVISHEIIVSEWITLQTLQRRFRPMYRSDFEDYSRQNNYFKILNAINASLFRNRIL